jgi:hypothetical protein
MWKAIVTEPTVQFLAAVGVLGILIAIVGLVLLNIGSALIGQDLVAPVLAVIGG